MENGPRPPVSPVTRPRDEVGEVTPSKDTGVVGVEVDATTPVLRLELGMDRIGLRTQETDAHGDGYGSGSSTHSLCPWNQSTSSYIPSPPRRGNDRGDQFKSFYDV